jgi:lactoylglutathione lyase
MKLNMLGLITSQIDVMKKFYRDVLDFEIIFETDNYVEFENEGIRFAISTNNVMHKTTGHNSYTMKKLGQSIELAFKVETPETVDTTYTKIIHKGATPIKSPEDKPWGQRAAFFADPDGNIHEIFADLPK